MMDYICNCLISFTYAYADDSGYMEILFYRIKLISQPGGVGYIYIFVCMEFQLSHIIK